MLPGDIRSEARAVNNSGQVVGFSYSSTGLARGFLSGGGLNDIGLFKDVLGRGIDINNAGQIVGTQAIGGADHAVFWENGVTTDLNDLIPAGSGWVLQRATKISDTGLITGNGTLNGQSRAFLLVPHMVSLGSTNLSLTVTPSQNPYVSGPLYYDVTVTNNGPDTARRVTVIPSTEGLSFPTASPTQGSCFVNAWNDHNVSNPTAYFWCALGDLAPGAGANVRVNISGVNTSNSLSLTATSHALEPDPDVANNTVTLTVLHAQADLALAVSDSPDPVPFGGTITYTITVTNNGPDTADGVTVTSAPLSSCNLGTLASGVSASCTRTATASTSGTISQPFSVRSVATDPNTANNFVTVTTTVAAPQADLAITMSDSPDPILLGGTITYTITVTNNGPDTATNVTASGTLPSCNFGTLASGASASCTPTAIASSVGTLTQTMSVGATEGDPNTANNSTSASTTVNPSADLAVSMTDSPDPVKIGAKLTYNITVTNSGPSNASDVTLTDTLPANTIFVSVTESQGSCSGTSTVTCNLGSIASGASANVEIVIRPKSTGTISNSASVSSSVADPNSTNNSATATTTTTTTVKR